MHKIPFLADNNLNMTPLRPVWLLVQMCVLYLLITHVKFPVIPVGNVDNIIVRGSKLKCESGCELMEDKISQFSCHKINPGSSSNDEDDNHVSVSYYDFECIPNVKVPDKAKMIIDKFQCQFSDEAKKMLIEDSCILVYMLEKRATKKTSGLVYDFLVWCLLSSILLYLIYLVWKEAYRKRHSPNQTEWKAPSVKEAVIDTGEDASKYNSERFANTRAEMMFDQGHSLIMDRDRRQRARSRSRRR